MAVFGWIGLLIGGLGLSLFASTRTVRHAQALAHGSRIPPFFIGVTLLAIGTDLPEIANSVVSCAAGHGDLNAGDSVGSAVTQATLVLGLLPMLGGAMAVSRNRILVISGACVGALALGAVLMGDGMLSRTDGIILLGAWAGGSALIWSQLSPSAPVESVPARSRARHAVLVLLFLAIVGASTGAAVAAFVRLSELFGVHEYVLSFFVASLGTSLPELVVDVMALRAGLKDMALGDVLGSSFVDATLSIGVGPVLFPAAVTGSLAIFGSAVAAAAIAAMACVLIVTRRHTWLTGLVLVGIYVGVYVVLLR